MLLLLTVVLINALLVKSFDDTGPPVTLTYNVVEEQPAGTKLADLLVDTGFKTTLNRSLLKQIYFSVLPGKYE